MVGASWDPFSICVETTDATTAQKEPLSAGWDALGRMEWEVARACFDAAVARQASAEALEGLGVAAWWLDDAAATFAARERAYSLYRRRGDRRSAARLATLLGIDSHQFRGEPAIGHGWFRRAHRLLEGLPPAPEHGWLRIWEGQIALIVGNDPATARGLGREAAELGRSLDVIDIEMTGLGLEGLALVVEGSIADGMALLDEATTAALGGEMSMTNAIGATCCYLIHACERVRDFDRAAQWCHKVQEFCRDVRWVSLFAVCRTHHASVLLWRGAWSEAEAELKAATRELEATRPGDVANGIVRLAELRRRQGRLHETQALLERVSFTTPALFGLAALALDRDKAADALDLVHRFLRHLPPENRTDRAAAFELAVRAQSALGQTEDAHAALRELDALADTLGTDPMRASAAFAHGVLAAAEGEPAAARRHLEDAVDLFHRAGAPFETACARLELAGVLRGVGRRDLAVQEARRAHDTLWSMGARLETRRSAAVLSSLGAPAPTRRGRGEPVFGLSGRELEVLRLVAQGLSNQQIATTLLLSEHTVRRHVANILGKLEVPSRAAAAALAAHRELL
jgi:LuxR family maltose regulon positive regulatory protein